MLLSLQYHPDYQICFDTWTFWFSSNRVFISHNSELTLPPPVHSGMPVTLRKQFMETFHVMEFIRNCPNYNVHVRFPIDNLNGALKYNEICLTGTGRDPGTATFCSPVSEPMGGNLLREAGAGGGDPRSMPVCLWTQQHVTECRAERGGEGDGPHHEAPCRNC